MSCGVMTIPASAIAPQPDWDYALLHELHNLNQQVLRLMWRLIVPLDNVTLDNVPRDPEEFENV